MANETIFEIRGNYFIALNVTTKKEYFRENPERIKYTRSESDDFVFYYNVETGNNISVVNSYILGNGRSSFIFSDSLDDNNNTFADADAFDTWLSTRTGGKQSAANYEERWDSFTASVSNAWTSEVLTGSPANRIVSILITTVNNNRTVGVRQVGSSLNRTVKIDEDSTVTMNVKTNASGEIQCFSNNRSGVLFYVQSYNN